MNLNELKTKLKSLKGAGYVQYLSRKNIELIDSPSQIDIEREIPLEIGLFDGKISVTVRLIDGDWYIDETDTSQITFENKEAPKDEEKDIKKYISVVEGKEVVIGQVWQEQKDPNCDGLEVKVFVKNIFMGFEGDMK